MSDRFPPAGQQHCRRCDAPLEPGAAFCPNCGLPQSQRAASPRRSTRPAWLLPAGIAGAGLLAIGAGVVLAVALSSRDEVGQTAQSEDPTPSPDQPASTSVAPSGSPSIGATPSPTPDSIGIIPNLAIAQVTTPALNLRSAPSNTSEVLFELPGSSLLFVIGEPEMVDDLRWYRVALIEIATADARFTPPACGDACEGIGWVATPAAGEESWIEELEIVCPASPMTGQDLEALHPLAMLHCFGNNEIVIAGTVAYRQNSPLVPFIYSPTWLADPMSWAAALLTETGYIPFRHHPDVQLDLPANGGMVRATGHFEDPAATTCRASLDPTYADASPQPVVPDLALVVLNCRATFVWTDYDVIGP